MLDLFCGAGGAGEGYRRAGFNVTGVDINPQPRYKPGRFIQDDALSYLARHGHEYDAWHASPPCQDHTALVHVTGATHGTGWMLPATLHLFGQLAGQRPWVVENVPGSKLPGLVLCGTEFELKTVTEKTGLRWLKRHRHFASNVFLIGGGGCHCAGRPIIGVYGHGGGGTGRGEKGTARDRRAVMGIDWMNRGELSQAIPPVYTEFIGGQLINYLKDALP
jgi:DNA (cytosine-5)-methyltransferase 1